MEPNKVLAAKFALMGLPCPILFLWVGVGSPAAILITFFVPVLIVAVLVGWELRGLAK